MKQKNRFKRVMVANRGEIAIRIFRACRELGIRSVAIYSEEDRNSLFRTKADESYLVGRGRSPVDAYLAIDEIIELAVAKNVDAIHPGYGFLAENPDFARACGEAGIVFIGPSGDMMEALGDKIKSKQVAEKNGVPVIPGVDTVIRSEDEAAAYAEQYGYPVILKAAAGGGGRGMRIVRDPSEIRQQFINARSEAGKAFGNDSVFIEKYIERPKHIEVQVLGDTYGNLVHLYERDCSVQRRHQKVVEFTPALCLTDEQRERICADALKLAGAVGYCSAGTVEFLVDSRGDHYFIEMNPRIQVEHTVTEMTTGVDIVQAQILIAEGFGLDSDEIGIKSQASVMQRGYAIQCRVTTEDPANVFAPDTGTITQYRSASGFGIRLDGGNAFTGSVISPYYDSLMVKVTSWAKTFEDAVHKELRALGEMKIEGVKNNTGFLINVLNHPQFAAGNCDTGFIADNPELLNIRVRQAGEMNVLGFLADKIVNVMKGEKTLLDRSYIQEVREQELAGIHGTKQILDNRGPEGLVEWIKEQDSLLLTDTTMRDAQQSLMATRMRTVDMEKAASPTALYGKELFSMEVWGGATFDTSYRFLKESPWERLDILRRKIPNLLLQMLIRGANGVGYKNYPDNVIRRFVRESASSGIDVFRIFDPLNWIDGMETVLDEVLEQGKVAETCICYTGDILDRSRNKYDLGYYVRMAKELEKRGSHILCIKDMAGLLKPMAAEKLIHALKQEVSIPIHLHTHDTSGNGVASVIMAANAGLDIADAAFSSMAGLTSQPALDSIAAALENTERATGLDLDKVQTISDYWAGVRPVYRDFESGLMAGSAEIYRYEIPGGQYSNLKSQIESFGLGHKFNEVKEMYRDVNLMLGDIVKVTPTSKAVGDMAIFMVQNDLTPENIYEKAGNLDFPDSMVSYFSGMMGQPEGGFPKILQELVLKGKKAVTCRMGEILPSENFTLIKERLRSDLELEGTEREALSYALYPKVFEEYIRDLREKGDFRLMESDVFFHGITEGEICEVDIAEGKTLVIRLISVLDADDSGSRDVVFEVNGSRIVVNVKDKDALKVPGSSQIMYADTEDPAETGANISGTIIKVFVKEGDTVEENQPVAAVEAMKMETNILASMGGTLDKMYVREGQAVKAGELVARISGSGEAIR